MGSNRGRQFYRSDFVPSVIARQRSNHVENDNFMQRLIASDPMYNNIRWIDEYMAYFRPNFFPPNPSFSRRGEFTAVPREMMNVNNRPYLIKYPPTIGDLQDMDQRRRHQMPRWVRSRTFWRQKRTDEHQEADHRSRQENVTEKEVKNSSGCVNWKNIWRSRWRDANYSTAEEVASYKGDEDTTAICNEALNVQEQTELRSVNEDGGSGEPAIEDPFIQEQKDILQLLKQCDYRHEMALLAGIGWYGCQTEEQVSSENEDDSDISIKMPDAVIYNSFADNENLSPKGRKKQTGFKQEPPKRKIRSILARKRKKLENNEVRTSAEMKGKKRMMREKLTIKRTRSGQNRTKENSGFSFLLQATKSSKISQPKNILKPSNTFNALNNIENKATFQHKDIFTEKIFSDSMNGKDLKCKQRVGENVTSHTNFFYVHGMKSSESDVTTVELENNKAEDKTEQGTLKFSGNDSVIQPIPSSSNALTAFGLLAEKFVVKLLLGKMLSCENILLYRKQNLISNSPTANVKSSTEEQNMSAYSLTAETKKYGDITTLDESKKIPFMKIRCHNENFLLDKSKRNPKQNSIDKKNAAPFEVEMEKLDHEKEVDDSKDLVNKNDNVFDKIYMPVNVSSDFVNEMMSYIDKITIRPYSKLNNRDTFSSVNQTGSQNTETLVNNKAVLHREKSLCCKLENADGAISETGEIFNTLELQQYDRERASSISNEENLEYVNFELNSRHFSDIQNIEKNALDDLTETKMTSTPANKEENRASPKLCLGITPIRLSEGL